MVGQTLENDRRKCLKIIAETQLLVREIGRNGGKEIAKYSIKGERKTDPYCGKFLRWCFGECGQKFSFNSARAIEWVQKEKIIWRYGNATKSIHVQPFDVSYSRRNAGSGHVEFVYDWGDDDEDEFYVLGGNVYGLKGQREGVHIKKRDKDRVIIINHINILNIKKK